MLEKTALLMVSFFFLSVASKAADTIKWTSAKASITEQGTLTVEVTAKVHLEQPSGRVCLYLQNENKALGQSRPFDVTVSKGDETVTIKRTIDVPQDLTLIYVFTPLYLNSEASTYIREMGRLTIAWSDLEKPSVKVFMPTK